jgi:hypothetical protein
VTERKSRSQNAMKPLAGRFLFLEAAVTSENWHMLYQEHSDQVGAIE